MVAAKKCCSRKGRTWRKDSDQLPGVPIGRWRRINQTHYGSPIRLLHKAGPDSPCVTLARVLTCRAEDGGRIGKRLSNASSQALACVDRSKYSSLCLTRVFQSCVTGVWIKAKRSTSYFSKGQVSLRDFGKTSKHQYYCGTVDLPRRCRQWQHIVKESRPVCATRA
jgi:hypothetical protein